jgi:hypothetical protein
MIYHHHVKGCALEADSRLMLPKYPFCWACVYELTTGFYNLRLRRTAFLKVKTVMLALPENSSGLEELQDEAMLLFFDNQTCPPHDGRLCPGSKLFLLRTRSGNPAFRIEIGEPGRYALFADKRFEECQAALYGLSGMVEPWEVLVFKPHNQRSDDCG